MILPEDGVSASQEAGATSISLKHLNSLRREIETVSGPVASWSVYCESARKNKAVEPYQIIEAVGEGASCVDDVARATIVYLWHWDRFRDEESLVHARECFKFLKHLKAPSGLFYNWLHTDGTINQTRINSLPGVSWWSMRALWAFGEGVRVLASFAEEAEDLAQEALSVTQILRQRMCAEKIFKERWDAAEGVFECTGQAGVALLGLTALYRVKPLPHVQKLIVDIANAIAECQRGTETDLPYQAFVASPEQAPVWHGWGSHEAAALAIAGRLLHEEQWVHAAERYVANLMPVVLSEGGPIYGLFPEPKHYEQIAYALEPMLMACTELHKITGKTVYMDMAHVACSWLFGGNSVNEPLYDCVTGRGYDGIRGDGVMNWNAGAESTIEALLSLFLLERLGIETSERFVDGHGKHSRVVAFEDGAEVDLTPGAYEVLISASEPVPQPLCELHFSIGEASLIVRVSREFHAPGLLPTNFTLVVGAHDTKHALRLNCPKLPGAHLVVRPLLAYWSARRQDGMTLAIVKNWSTVPQHFPHLGDKAEWSQCEFFTVKDRDGQPTSLEPGEAAILIYHPA